MGRRVWAEGPENGLTWAPLRNGQEGVALSLKMHPYCMAEGTTVRGWGFILSAAGECCTGIQCAFKMCTLLSVGGLEWLPGMITNLQRAT